MMLAIYGPTATGKTNLAISLAKRFNGELISADSRQVYIGLDIGTGKVSFESQVEKRKGYGVVDGVKIHGFDLLDPGQQFSVADFINFAKTTTIRIIEQKKVPIVVGGTGFYIKALLDGVESVGIPRDPKLRNQLEKLKAEELYQKLKELNPERAKSMNQSDRANPRRLVRAIEIASSSHKLQATNYHLPTTNYFILGLTAPNTFLYQKSENWIKERLEKGMVEEIKGLIDQGISIKWLDDLGLEYRWLSRYLSGKVDYSTALNRLIGDIHDFIRRQKTWFKKFPNIQLFDISTDNWQKEIEEVVGNRI